MSRGRILLGMVLVVLGVVLWLDRIRGTNEAHAALAFFGRWWPAGLIVLGAVYLGSYLRDRWWLWGPVLLIVFGLLGLTVRDVPARASDFLLPAMLAAAGLAIAMTGSRAPDPHHPRYTAVLRGRRVSATASEMRMGSAAAFLGHLELDLTRGATLYDGRGELNVTAILGRIELLIPPGWEVERHRSVEFPSSAVTDHKLAGDAEVSESVGAPHLTLHTTTIFGSVEITTVPLQAVTSG
jgi:hypothetical protein